MTAEAKPHTAPVSRREKGPTLATLAMLAILLVVFGVADGGASSTRPARPVLGDEGVLGRPGADGARGQQAAMEKADSSGFELYETALKVRPSGFAVLRSTIESIGVGHPQAGHRESDPTTHHLIQQSEICAFDQ